jgi:hypothetical protein
MPASTLYAHAVHNSLRNPTPASVSFHEHSLLNSIIYLFDIFGNTSSSTRTKRKTGHAGNTLGYAEEGTRIFLAQSTLVLRTALNERGKRKEERGKRNETPI